MKYIIGESNNENEVDFVMDIPIKLNLDEFDNVNRKPMKENHYQKLMDSYEKFN